LFVFDLCCVVFVYLRRLVAEAPASKRGRWCFSHQAS
jgi:hypothetical protein